MIAVGVILLLVAVAACPGPPRRAGRFDDRQLHTTIFEALSGIEMSPHCYTMWFYSGTNFTRYLSETAGSRFSAPGRVYTRAARHRILLAFQSDI